MYVVVGGHFGRHRVTVTCDRVIRPCPSLLTNGNAGSGQMVVALTVLFLAGVAGEIRCFCNQPSCVSTGYMCKSRLGLCFLETTTTHGNRATRTVHACAEALPEARRVVCAAARDDVTVSSSARKPEKTNVENPQSNLICCGTDMCNYKPRLLINIHVVSRENVTSTKDSLVNRSLDVSNDWLHSNSRRIWFRICIIAVPVVGSVVLGLIVFAAVRMLRKDRRLHHHHHHRCHHSERLHQYSVSRHLANDRLTSVVPLANAACKNGAIFVEPQLTLPQLLESSSHLFTPAKQSQWRKQRIRPSSDWRFFSSGVSVKIPPVHNTTILKIGCCPGCVRDAYVLAEQRTNY